MSERRDNALELIAKMPLVDEFDAAQRRTMHQFMVGWRRYESLVMLARLALKDEADGHATD